MTDAPALEQLATALADAREARAAEVAALAEMDADQLAYLAAVDQLPDPMSDGLEMDRG